MERFGAIEVGVGIVEIEPLFWLFGFEPREIYLGDRPSYCVVVGTSPHFLPATGKWPLPLYEPVFRCEWNVTSLAEVKRHRYTFRQGYFRQIWSLESGWLNEESRDTWGALVSGSERAA